MPADPITARTLALRLLRYLGVTSLDPTDPAEQPFPIEPADLDDVLGVINSALQDYMDASPAEVRESNLGVGLHAPTTVTLGLTNGSNVISGFTSFAAWMLGCTIRVAGDPQDNEVSSQTLLARPFMGTTGANITATVYGDSVQLDDTVGKVLNPVAIPNQIPLLAATNRMEFMRLAGYPLVTNSDGSAYGYPFFWFVRKSISRPMVWFLESAYTAGLSYVPRRIRVAPMPDQPYAMGFRAALNATRLQASDVDNGDHTTDPMTLLPIADSEVESILMKICANGMTELAQFKNAGAIPGIQAAYKRALDKMRNIRGQATVTHGRYV